MGCWGAWHPGRSHLGLTYYVCECVECTSLHITFQHCGDNHTAGSVCSFPSGSHMNGDRKCRTVLATLPTRAFLSVHAVSRAGD